MGLLPPPEILAAYGGLLTLAIVSIYAGSYATLPAEVSRLRSYALKERGDEDEDEVDNEPTERISSGDAYLFPFLGAAVLLSLYYIMKFLGPEWLSLLIGWYFALTGTLSVWRTSTSLLKRVMGRATWNSFRQWNLKMPYVSADAFSLRFRTPSLIMLPMSVVPSAMYILIPGEKRSMLLGNILALSLTHTALALLKLDSFATGVVLLSGLFFYDIWFVFYTEVMVSVATGLDVPIKLVWPKSFTFTSSSGSAMLGLGDIVIPGAFISLCLRYDFARAVARIRASDGKPIAVTTPYFTAGMTGYTIGLLTTIFVMHTFRAAQPALLYLSPACIISFFATAWALGELKQALAYDDGEEDEKRRLEKDAQVEPTSEDPPVGTVDERTSATTDGLRKRT
ncbi:signal peptide peptidase-domain-containing protein [Auriculariales sp. MPI-PUGE-AT-0066]|nr:signal peptide peptidase-domain-containing protein [Auriculariales sp. MPI-PUGE-AT-0066]